MFSMAYVLIWGHIPMTEFLSGLALGELTVECVWLWTSALYFTLTQRPSQRRMTGRG